MLLLLVLVTANKAGSLKYRPDSFYWFRLGEWGRCVIWEILFMFRFFPPQETAGFVFSFKCLFKKSGPSLEGRNAYMGSSPNT